MTFCSCTSCTNGVVISEIRNGSSLGFSPALPQYGWRIGSLPGPSSIWWPVARASSATVWPYARATSGSQVAPSAIPAGSAVAVSFGLPGSASQPRGAMPAPASAIRSSGMPSRSIGPL